MFTNDLKYEARDKGFKLLYLKLLKGVPALNDHDYIVSLDIGTSMVRVIIGEMNHNSMNIIGVGTSDSDGIKKGAIVDIDLTVKSIRKAIEHAEHMVGLPIQQVFVGITGNHIGLQPSHGVVAVSSADREIEEEDIIRVIDASKVMALPPEREIIDVVPKQFIVDGLDGIRDPRGMIGVRLEMEGTIITGSKTAVHNLARCIEKAGLTIAGIFLEPLSTSSMALTKDEKSLGIVLADIGAGQTSVSIFEHGSLVNTSVIPIGGEYITNDIAIGFKTQTEIAERIKLQHGIAIADDAMEDETFTVSRVGSDSQKEYNQVDLAHIIEPRVIEIFDLIKYEVKRQGMNDSPGGFVLTGGVMSMPGTLDLAQEIFNNSVRIATPDFIGVREPQYSASVGLIRYAMDNTRQHQDDYDSKSSSAPARQSQGKKNSAQHQESVTEKVKNWFKEFI